MTVPNANNRVQYVGNGSVTGFPVTYPFLEGGHLRVLLTNRFTLAETQQVLGVDYTVSQEDDFSGTVNFSSAPGDHFLVTILRQTPVTQLIDWVENDPFPAQAKEDALDKLTMICQDLLEIFSRGVLLPPTIVGEAPTLGLRGLTNIFPARITSPSVAGVSSFAEVVPDAGAATWSTRVDGAAGAARSTNGCADDYEDQIVLVLAYVDEDDNVDYRFEPPGACQ